MQALKKSSTILPLPQVRPMLLHQTISTLPWVALHPVSTRRKKRYLRGLASSIEWSALHYLWDSAS